MQVLGDLVQLGNDGQSLPLPWWQRAPLGLLHGTDVHVGLIKGSRPVGDIVVSVLDITKWNNMVRLDCSHSEERGVLAGLMEAVLPLNIALAEAVTTEMGKEHRATLFCEDKGILRVKDVLPRIEESLKRNGFQEIKLHPYLSRIQLEVLERCLTRINHGWLNGIPFLKWIQANYDEVSRQQVDLRRAVVSADTENRLLRFVFPYRGAKSVKVRHTDSPGALRAIFRAFMACELNVLSALLRRGGQQHGYSELIAVCEPLPTQNPVEVYDRLGEQIRKTAPDFDITATFSDGRPAGNVIYLPPPNHVTPAGMKSLFFSARHAHDGPHHQQMTENVLRVLRDFRWWPLDSGTKTAYAASDGADDRALMERAEGGVLIITGIMGPDNDLPKMDLMHQLGYLQAVGRPLLLITDQESGVPLQRWTQGCRSTVISYISNAAELATEAGIAQLETTLRDWTFQSRHGSRESLI